MNAEMSLVEAVRKTLPSLANRREDVFAIRRARATVLRCDASRSPALARSASRATWKGAKDCAVAISSIVFTLTCRGRLAAQWIDSAMSSAVSGCMPA